MDGHSEQAGDIRPQSGDPVADDIEQRNPDSGDIVAGEQVLDEGHVAPDQEGDENSAPDGADDDAPTADQARATNGADDAEHA